MQLYPEVVTNPILILGFVYFFAYAGSSPLLRGLIPSCGQRWAGFSLWWVILSWSMGSRRLGSIVAGSRVWGSAVMVHQLSYMWDLPRTCVSCILRQILYYCAT